MAWDREKEKKAGKAMTMGSCVFGLVFSIFWCIAAASMGAWFMLIFGIPFVGMMVYRLYVLSQYAKEEPTSAKETDPWDRPAATKTPGQTTCGEGRFCPYCGGERQESFAYCPICRRKLPE